MINGSLFDGKYKILDTLGKGGMSTVYLAENIKLGTLWAIKQIPKVSTVKIDTYVEPNILKQLNHPALPRIFDIAEDVDCVYIIVDYIEGIALDRELEKVKCFPEKIVIEWTKQLCDVLFYLHSHTPNPIIYRDMKPSNIILTKEGSIKLIDFGIAREFRPGSDSDTVYIGTRGYAAPEQFGKGQTSAASDIYSLGVMLMELLTGKNPNTPPLGLRSVREHDSSLSEGIENIICRCTREEPGERYRSVKEILIDIEDINSLGSVSETRKVNYVKNSSLPTDYKKVVGFTGGSSSGVTTVIAALSEYFSKSGRKTAIVDLTTNRRLYEMFGQGYRSLNPDTQELAGNSLRYLLQGELKAAKLDRKRELYMSDAPLEIDKDKYIDIIDPLKASNDVVLLDMDFCTSPEVLKHIDNLYVVKDMNLYTMKETAEYIEKLKSRPASLLKLKIIISKHVGCSVKPQAIIDTITASNSGQGFLTHKRPEFFVVPFEISNYKMAIDNINSPYFSCEGYSDNFKKAVGEIGRSIYPVRDGAGLKGFFRSIISR